MENVEDDVSYMKRKIELARLDESEILPGVQSLTMDGGQKDLFLLQLNAEVMKNVAEGDTLIIRGEPNESAVMCSDSKTYELREAETSNSLLLLPDLSWPEECEKGELRVIPRNICGVFHNYFELRELKPNFQKLKAVLEANSYKGKEYEDDSAKHYTFEDLLDFIQASEQELKEALVTLHTCVIDGFVRILDFDYKFNVLSQVIEAADSKSFPLDRVDKDAIVKELQELIPNEITEKCFQWFAHEIEAENGQKLFAFDENSICRMYAEILLRAAKKFDLGEFLESWQRSVPEGMKCDLAQLRGLALTDMNYSPEVIFYFPCDEMPENVADRFTKLFRIKEKWTYEEIVPYLQDRSSDVKSLLIKFTRESTKDGVKLYSSKW